MRLNKQKRHRKAVRFYTACFDFREPFKVLCDGTFVHHMLVNQITLADTALAYTLGAPVKIFTTRCILAELRSLGDSYAESLNLLMDARLRKKFQEIAGVPVVYGLWNALFLEPPSAFQRQFAKSAEEERAHMTELEYKMINTKKRRVSIEEEKDFSDANESKEDHKLGVQIMRTNIGKNRGDFRDKIQFKRKKAKGPSPLSCKKKKRQGNANNPLQERKARMVILLLEIVVGRGRGHAEQKILHRHLSNISGYQLFDLRT